VEMCVGMCIWLMLVVRIDQRAQQWLPIGCTASALAIVAAHCMSHFNLDKHWIQCLWARGGEAPRRRAPYLVRHREAQQCLHIWLHQEAYPSLENTLSSAPRHWNQVFSRVPVLRSLKISGLQIVFISDTSLRNSLPWLKEVCRL